MEILQSQNPAWSFIGERTSTTFEIFGHKTFFLNKNVIMPYVEIELDD